MKKLTLLLLAVAAVLLIFAGCASTSLAYPAASVPLEEAEYEILGDTQAEATGVVILGLPIAGRKMGSFSYPMESFAFKGMSALGRVKANALYKTLKQMPEADAVVEPKWEIESFRFLFFFSRHKVRVTAKGIRLIEGIVEKDSD